MSAKIEVLANGLTVLGMELPAMSSAAVGFFTRTGARDETPSIAGVSHFLEHMVFKGTKKRSSMEITYEMGNLGAQANAFTSDEATVFYGAVVPEVLPKMTEILADMMRPAFDPTEYESERKVILEEIALYQDRPHYFLYEKAIASFFNHHPLGSSVLGSTTTIGALPREEMVNYHARRYYPNNMVLAATGKFSFVDLVAQAKVLTADWEQGEAPRIKTPLVFTPTEQTFTKKDLMQTQLMYLAPGPSVDQEERYALSVLMTIIGDAVGSKLYWELVHTGIVESVGADVDEKADVGVFSVQAEFSPDRKAEVIEKIDRILANPLEFSDDELKRAKTKLLSRIVLGRELPMGMLMNLGLEFLSRRRVVTLEEVQGKVAAVGRTDIAQALEKFPLTRWSKYFLEAA